MDSSNLGSFCMFLLIILCLYCRYHFKKVERLKQDFNDLREKYINNFDDFQKLANVNQSLINTNDQFYSYFQYLFDEGLFDDYKKYLKNQEKKKKLEESRKII